MARSLRRADRVINLDEVDDAPLPGLGSQLVRFASVGVVSTVLFAGLFLVLAGPLGSVFADVVALALCSVANTAANRRLTFALRGRHNRTRHYSAALALSALPLGLTLAALGALATMGVSSLFAQLAVLTAVYALATLARFILLRAWVFRHRRAELEAG